MANYISDRNITKLEPMNANVGIFLCEFSGSKKEKRSFYVEHALNAVKEFAKHV